VVRVRAAQRRAEHRAIARLRRLTLWTRRMMRRRGGFLVLLDAGATVPDGCRFTAGVRHTNAPQALRQLFNVSTAWRIE